MPNDDGLFTRAEVDKAVRERIKEMKDQRDTARDEAATFKKQHAESAKALEAATLKAERADGFEAQVAEVQGKLDAFKTRSGRESIIRDALGDKYSKGAALGIIGTFAETEDAGEFADYVSAQVESRSGLIGGLLGPATDPDAPPPTASPPPSGSRWHPHPSPRPSTLAHPARPLSPAPRSDVGRSRTSPRRTGMLTGKASG